jgi:hypothetical protein
MPKKKLSEVRRRKRVKKAGAVVARRTKRAGQLAGQAVTEQKSIAEIRPRRPYGFLLPRRLSQNFNAAGQLVEVQALPNYLRDTVKAKDLADFRLVLGGLAQRGNRDAIFPVEIEQYLAMTDSEHERRALDIVEGKSPMGFNLTVLAAKSDLDRQVFLYVLEDRLRRKMAVAGPEKIPAGLKKQLERDGVSYAVRKSNECDAVIDDFVADGAQHRCERGFLLDNNIRTRQSVIGDLVRGLNAVSEIKETGINLSNMPLDYTLGRAIRHSGPEPACYTSIVCATQTVTI